MVVEGKVHWRLFLALTLLSVASVAGQSSVLSLLERQIASFRAELLPLPRLVRVVPVLRGHRAGPGMHETVPLYVDTGVM